MRAGQLGLSHCAAATAPVRIAAVHDPITSTEQNATLITARTRDRC